MTPSDREPTGQRIARARRRRGLSQAVLAGLAGRSESWLSQVERGKRGVDSHSVLVRLAEVLRVDVEELTGSADRDETGRRAYAVAPLIEQAMMGYALPARWTAVMSRDGRPAWTSCARRRAPPTGLIRPPVTTRRAVSCPG
jgi:transcriptional regulator with XRE-family HTH domain